MGGEGPGTLFVRGACTVVMMLRCARVLALAALGASVVAGCASADAPTADPEALKLDPPVVIVDEPAPEDEATVEPVSQVDDSASLKNLAKDPNTEVITFVGADAPPAMTDEVTAAPKRAPLPSMMSDMVHGPNK